jgi:hypothetical protein
MFRQAGSRAHYTTAAPQAPFLLVVRFVGPQHAAPLQGTRREEKLQAAEGRGRRALLGDLLATGACALSGGTQVAGEAR